MKSSPIVFGPNLNLLHAKYFSDSQAVGDNFLRIKSQLTLLFPGSSEVPPYKNNRFRVVTACKYGTAWVGTFEVFISYQRKFWVKI